MTGRSQHWTIDGFRITVLVYKSHRGERCDACGQPGAVNAVWANERQDGFSSGSAQFCDRHRPERGTLPDLDYQRHYRHGEFSVSERLFPSPEWPCGKCGQPGRYRVTLPCGGCEEFTVTEIEHVIRGLTGEDFYRDVDRHKWHDLAEWYECDAHRTPVAGLAGMVAS